MHDYYFPYIMQMFMPTGYEWIFVIIIAVILIFGAKKIPELARGFGRATTEFEKVKMEANKEFHSLKNIGIGNTTDYTNINREKLESIADMLGVDYINKSDEELRIAVEREINRKQQ